MPLLCYTLPILSISILCDPLPRPFLSRLCRCHSVQIHSSPCLGLSMQFLCLSTPGISLHCPLVATPRYSSALPDYSLLILFNTALCHIRAYQCHGCSNLIFSFPSQCFSMPCLRYSLLCISFPSLYFTPPLPSVTVHLQANQCRFFEMPPEGLFSGGTADLFSRTAHTEPLRPVCWARSAGRTRTGNTLALTERTSIYAICRYYAGRLRRSLAFAIVEARDLHPLTPSAS